MHKPSLKGVLLESGTGLGYIVGCDTVQEWCVDKVVSNNEILDIYE